MIIPSRYQVSHGTEEDMCMSHAPFLVDSHTPNLQIQSCHSVYKFSCQNSHQLSLPFPPQQHQHHADSRVSHSPMVVPQSRAFVLPQKEVWIPLEHKHVDNPH